MKRILIVVSATAFWVAALALPAFADYPPKGVPSPMVLPQVVRAPSGTAFTGSNTVALVIAALVLLVVGTAALATARKLRRAGAA